MISACEQTIGAPPAPECQCENGGSCVTSLTGVVECKCASGYQGYLCQRLSSAIAAGQNQTGNNNALKIAVPVVVILLLIVAGAVGGYVFIYKRRSAVSTLYLPATAVQQSFPWLCSHVWCGEVR